MADCFWEIEDLHSQELWDVLDVEVPLRIADSQLLPFLDVTSGQFYCF